MTAIVGDSVAEYFGRAYGSELDAIRRARRSRRRDRRHGVWRGGKARPWSIRAGRKVWLEVRGLACADVLVSGSRRHATRRGHRRAWQRDRDPRDRVSGRPVWLARLRSGAAAGGLRRLPV